jgi:outer membrane receptor protein involved in Fe transport
MPATSAAHPLTDSTEVQKTSFWNRFRLAEVDSAAASGANAVGDATSGADSQSRSVEEVIVTPQKRSENLQEVPIPVSVVNTTALADNNQTRLRDYFETVPGFIVTPGVVGSGQQMLTIRGVSSGAYGNPTVGITVDGIPYGPYHGEYAPDIDPSDLARVEVLRGPQGTLYGASSLGGLLNYVTIDLVYARMASGYRPGSSNSSANYNLDPAMPHASAPDKTRNFEIGSKGDVPNHLLSYDVSLYYIDWKDIQISLFSTRAGVGYFTNGSGAKS